MFQTKLVEKIKACVLSSMTFSANRAVYEIIIVIIIGSAALGGPWPPLSFRGFVTIFFKGWGFYPHPQPPTWRTRVSRSVWVITCNLSGTGGPTSTIRYRQHSSRDHLTTLHLRGAVYEIIRKKVAAPDRPQMAVWCMRFACWISKAIDTHSEYVIPTAFPLQLWLRESAWMLRLYVNFLPFFSQISRLK